MVGVGHHPIPVRLRPAYCGNAGSESEVVFNGSRHVLETDVADPAGITFCMSTPSVLSLAASRGRADKIIHELIGAGFTTGELGLLFLDHRTERDRAHERNAAASHTAGAESAGPIRGVMASITGIRLMIVPGAGAFIAAGPFIEILQTNGIGRADSAFEQGLIELGVPPPEAGRCVAGVLGGQILISVRAAGPARVARARELVTASGAQDVCTTSAVPAPVNAADSSQPATCL